MPSELASDLLDVLDQLSEGVHPGFRPVHARGVMYSGKIIFDPVPRVDGIESAGDPLTEVRSDLYLLSGRRRRADAAK